MGKEALINELFTFENVIEEENKIIKMKQLLRNMKHLKSGINLFYNATEKLS